MGKDTTPFEYALYGLTPEGQFPTDRFTDRIREAMSTPPFGFDIRPKDSLAFVRESDDDTDVLVGQWSLEPVWLRDPKALKLATFNARADKLTSSGTWKHAASHARCVVPVSGFYEWQIIPGGTPSRPNKQKWWIYRSEQQPLILAGLYARHTWGDSFTVVTTDANAMMAEIHNAKERMPVVLDPDQAERWLDPAITDIEELRDLLQPSPVEWLDAHKVRKLSGDGPQLIEPIES